MLNCIWDSTKSANRMIGEVKEKIIQTWATEKKQKQEKSKNNQLILNQIQPHTSISRMTANGI